MIRATALWMTGLLAGALLGPPPTPPAGREDPEAEPHRRGSILYVASRGSAELRALNRDTGEILATIEVGKLPSGLAARADGDRIYVVCAGSHTLQVIDGATRKILDTVTLTHGAAPGHVALSPDETTVYVAATGLDAVYAIDAGSLQQVAEIAVGREPVRLAVAPDGRRLYVLCAGAGRLDVVDTVGRRILFSPAVGSRPTDLALDRVTGAVYVTRRAAPALSRLADGAAQVTEIPIDAPAEALASDGVTRRLLLASPSVGRILQLVPATGATTFSIRAPDVTRLAVDPEGKMLYALSARRGVLVYLNRIMGTAEREVPVGKAPWDLVLVP